MRWAVRIAVLLLAVAAFFPAFPADAGEPQIYRVRVQKIGRESYEFDVMVSHNDVSWDHFLDRWEIVGPGGKVVATRVFYHPHIGEDYVTRSLRGVTIPDGVQEVIVRVHDKVHGYGRERLVFLPTDANPDTGWK